MSIRARRIIETKTNGPSFNLWGDEALVDWLRRETSFFSSLNPDGIGLTDVDVEDLKRALVEIGPLEEETRKAIEEDIKSAEETDRDYVQYYCS